MPVKIVNVSPKIEVEDEKHIVFPPEVKGSVEPGSLDHLRSAQSIRWGNNMLDLIKPNTIPECVGYLHLPPNYAHPIDDSNLITKVNVYLHHSSIQCASSKNSFFVWKGLDEPEPVLPKGWRKTSNWTLSITFSNAEIIRAERIPESVVLPPPKHELTCTTKSLTSLQKKKAYLETERAFVQARQVYIDDKIAALDEQLAQTSA